MKEVTVIELSEQTGLTRSQIYYLNKIHNLINLNEKINYEYAFPIIIALTIKKAKRANEKNFRQILDMLILQNIALQKQLDLANEREKNHLLELTSCQQSLAQNNTLIPSIDQDNAQSALKNDVDEKSQNPIQSEKDMYASKASCYSNNTESESASENDIQPLPTTSFNNEMILSKSDTSDSEPIRQKNKVIEKKEITQLVTPSATQNNTQHPLAQKICKKEANVLPIQTVKNILASKNKSHTNKQSEQAPENEAVADQSKVNKDDHRD